MFIVWAYCHLRTWEKKIMINQVLSSNTKSQSGLGLHCAKLFKKTQQYTQPQKASQLSTQRENC